MELTIRVKQPGRKHALINDKKILVEDIGDHPVAKDIIAAVVRQQVNEYNSKPHEINLVSFLTDAAISEQEATGKIGFGSIYSEAKADATRAVAVAIQAFEDGMFALFINDDEITDLSKPITINPTTIITFIRFTFLAGSFW